MLMQTYSHPGRILFRTRCYFLVIVLFCPSGLLGKAVSMHKANFLSRGPLLVLAVLALVFLLAPNSTATALCSSP